MNAGRRLSMIVACALFIENMDASAIATSLPAIAADRFGARSTFMAAIAVFPLGSLACAARGVVSAASAWVMFRLPADVGQEMSGRAQPGQEIAEPKAAQRPGT